MKAASFSTRRMNVASDWISVTCSSSQQQHSAAVHVAVGGRGKIVGAGHGTAGNASGTANGALDMQVLPALPDPALRHRHPRVRPLYLHQLEALGPGTSPCRRLVGWPCLRHPFCGSRSGPHPRGRSAARPPRPSPTPRHEGRTWCAPGRGLGADGDLASVQRAADALSGRRGTCATANL